MTLITRLDDRDSRRKAVLSIKDSYTAEVKHFVSILDIRNLELNLKGLLAYSEYLNGSPAGTQNRRFCSANNRIRYSLTAALMRWTLRSHSDSSRLFMP
jgi:hypothetical protein